MNLGNHPNGNITYGVDDTPDYDLGTNAIYNCNYGYSLNGTNVRTCVQDDQLDTVGNWSGRMPTCERKSCAYHSVLVRLL